jgi:hypothetical protein
MTTTAASATSNYHYVVDGWSLEAYEEHEEEEGIVVHSDSDSAFDEASFKNRSANGYTHPSRPANLCRRDSTAAIYNEPKSSAEAERIQFEGGLVWHAKIVRDDYSDPKHTTATGDLKMRRPLPQARESEFFNSLVQTHSGKWIFSGILNGWPSLTELEIESVTVLVSSLIGRKKIRRFWSSLGPNNEQNRAKPSFPSDPRVKSVRVTLRAPNWTAFGWSESSPGRVFHYAPERRVSDKMAFGTNTAGSIRAEVEGTPGMGMPQAVRAHHFAHRYAVKKEGVKDILTYHALILVEWNHAQYTTVFELAWLNGVSGYGGKANWLPDRDAARPAMLDAMPNEMKAPWISNLAEIRIINHAAKNVGQFQDFLSEHTGTKPPARFMFPELVESASVRISHRGMDDLLTYCLNYIGNDPKYSEENRNCQTFAADFYSFLCAKKNVVPYYPLNRVLYVQRHHLFLYDPPDPSKKQMEKVASLLDMLVE